MRDLFNKSQNSNWFLKIFWENVDYCIFPEWVEGRERAKRAFWAV